MTHKKRAREVSRKGGRPEPERPESERPESGRPESEIPKSNVWQTDALKPSIGATPAKSGRGSKSWSLKGGVPCRVCSYAPAWQRCPLRSRSAAQKRARPAGDESPRRACRAASRKNGGFVSRAFDLRTEKPRDCAERGLRTHTRPQRPHTTQSAERVHTDPGSTKGAEPNNTPGEAGRRRSPVDREFRLGRERREKQ